MTIKKLFLNIAFYIVLAVFALAVFFGVSAIKKSVKGNKNQTVYVSGGEKVRMADYNLNLYFTKEDILGKADILNSVDLEIKLENNESVEEQLKKGTENTVKFDLAILKIAKENGITLNEKEKAAASHEESEFINEITKTGTLDEFLKINRTDEEAITRHFLILQISEALKTRLFSKGGKEDLTLEEYKKAQTYFEENREKYKEISLDEFFEVMLTQKYSSEVIKTTESIELTKEKGFRNIEIR